MPVFFSDIRSFRGLVLCAAVLATAGGCGLVQDRSDNYQQARLAEGLKLPESLADRKVNPAYSIPEAGEQGRRALVNSADIPKPPDLTENILDENHVVETAGDQAWLLVNEKPGRVWPSVVRFLTDQGLEVEYENPRVGLLQTEAVNYSLRARDFLDLGDEDSTARTVVQARVSPGVRRNTSEVQLRVRKLDGPADEFLQWPPESEHFDLEERLLERMSDYMQAQEGVKSYSRAARDIAEDPRVRLMVPDNASARIELDLNYERAWAEVSRALEESGVPVVDINRSEGLWYLDYRSEEARTSGFWFWKSIDEPRFTYQVQLQRTEEGPLWVTAQEAPNYDGIDRSERLLSEIYENLY